MKEQSSALKTLQKELPPSYSDSGVNELEQRVTRYQEILNHIAKVADPENTTLYYRERLHAIETELVNAKYGHTEKQRIAGFQTAKEFLEEGITALLNYLHTYSNSALQ